MVSFFAINPHSVEVNIMDFSLTLFALFPISDVYGIESLMEKYIRFACRFVCCLTDAVVNKSMW